MLYLSIHTQTDDTLDRISDFLSLSSVKFVNDVGYIKFSLLANHPSAFHLDYLNIIKLYRNDVNVALAWYQENIGIITDIKYFYNASGVPLIEVIAYHPNYLLTTRIVAYNSNVIGRSIFINTQVSIIAKAIVIYNATTASGEYARIRTGANTLFPIQVAASADTGSLIDFTCSLQPLLLTLQRLSSVGSGDFNLVDVGTGRFEFRWYNGQLGTDRSSTILFSIDRDNMTNPVYTLAHNSSISAAIAAGRGEGSLQEYAVRYSSAYTPAYDIESFCSGKSASTYNGLTIIADAHLASFSYKPSLSFNIVQTPSTFYGKHYFLGDLISIVNPFTSETYIGKITAVSLDVLSFSSSSSSQSISITISISSNSFSSPSILSSSINDSVYTNNFINPSIDCVLFTDTVFPFLIDCLTFTSTYLSDPIDGGLFAAPPG